MKVGKIVYLLFIVSSISFGSCKNKSSESATGIDEKVEIANEVPKGKYSIKSGIVEYKTEMMGVDAKQIITFDDFGKKEITEVLMDVMGTKIHSVTLNKDGYIYNYDMVNKTGTKRLAANIKTPDIDFENMTKEMIKDMNLKKIGSEKFLGKNCEKVTIDSKSMQMKGTYLIYKGVPLMVNTDLGTMKMNLLAQKFIENPSISDGKFSVPADVKISEK